MRRCSPANSEREPERGARGAGVCWDEVVKLNFFVTDLSEVAALREIRDEYANTARPPASTLVQVAALFWPDVMFEADAVAVTG